MALPKIKYPIFELTLPSTKTKIKFRPFTVKEEKLLLIAQESEQLSEKLNAIRQIINNCMFDLPKDVGLLPSFDLEYCFLKIRSKSVSNIVELSYRDKTDDKIYNFEVYLDELEMTYDETHNTTIELEENLGVVMQYPTVEILNQINPQIDSVESTMAILKKCIAMIYDADNTYPVEDCTDKELTEFIESLPTKNFEKLSQFFDTMPVLKHEMHYTDSEGTKKTITLQGIDDFFQ